MLTFYEDANSYALHGDKPKKDDRVVKKKDQYKKPETQTSQQQTNLNKKQKQGTKSKKTVTQHPMEETGEEHSKTPIFQIVKLFFISIECVTYGDKLW